MKLYLFIIMLILALNSCFIKENRSEKIKQEKVKVIFEENGKYIYFKFTGEKTYLIVWGNEQFKNISVDTFSYYMGHSPLELIWHNDNIFELRQSCGSPCWYTIILPIKKDVHEKKYMYPVAYDRKNNLIAYYKEDLDTTQLIVVENYLNRKDTIISGNWCKSYWVANCIDSVSLQNRELYLERNEGRYFPEKKSYEIKKQEIFKINL